MWYVLEAEEGATVCYGFTHPITRKEMRKRIENRTLSEVLNQIPAKKGDVFLIEAGTIHAIGAGVMIAEIQQNSNTTYRVYDYDRKDKDGNKRELHIEEAIAVTDTSYAPGIPSAAVYEKNDGYAKACLASCRYFTVFHLKIDTHAKLRCDTQSFQSLLCITGYAIIFFTDTSAQGKDSIPRIDIKKGMSVFIPAGMGDYRIEGECEVLLTQK